VPRGTETILLVEAEANLRKLAAGILGALGYRVLEAEGMADAVEFARKPDAEGIRLLLAGVGSGGSNGSELAAAIRTSCREIRVLFLGSPADALAAPEQSKSSVAWLAKPYTLETLATAVRELLDRT